MNNEENKLLHNKFSMVSSNSINKVLELMHKSEIDQYELLDKYSHCLMTIVKLCSYPGEKKQLLFYICKTTLKFCKELQDSLKNTDIENINLKIIMEYCEDITK